MNQIKLFLAFFVMHGMLVTWAPASAQDKVAIIVNPGNPVDSLSSTDLKKIFKGTMRTWDDGSKIVPVLSRTELNEFYDLIGMTKTQYDKHRIKASLSGNIMPLKRLNDDAAVVDYIGSHKEAIGCVSSGQSLTGTKKIQVSD